uniref:UNC93-like protein n=1 Tax=Strigamia maritima TaxID=126957 RepID=T1ILI9_STRMM
MPPPIAAQTQHPASRLSATQLCILDALRTSPQITQGQYNRGRRGSHSFPLEQRSAALLSNYTHSRPSVWYLEGGENGHLQLDQHSRAILEPRRRVFYYWRNLLGISVSILCLLVAYNSFFYVQSSLYSKNGLGTMALAVDYIAQVISCFFAPALLMRRLGCKWALFVSMFCISLYIAANFYATWWTLLPAAAVMGLGFAAMWATMNTCVSDLASGYAQLKGLKPAPTVSRFFGIFYMTIETAKIWGNVISSAVLTPSGKHDQGMPGEMCGAAYCNQPLTGWNETVVNNSIVAMSQTTIAGTSLEQVNTLCGIALGIALFSLLLVAALLNPMRTTATHVASASSLDKLLSTIRLHSNRNLQLLIVITIDVGLVQSFFVGDFTKAFLTCALGIHRVGLVATSYGVATVLGCIVTGYLAQIIGRPTLVVGAVILNVGDLIFMLLWTPNKEQIWIFFVMASVWGIALSVWLTQLSALYARVFKDKHEDAFSNHRAWECIGFVIGFAWAQYLCMPLFFYFIFLILKMAVDPRGQLIRENAVSSLRYLNREINRRRLGKTYALMLSKPPVSTPETDITLKQLSKQKCGITANFNQNQPGVMEESTLNGNYILKPPLNKIESACLPLDTKKSLWKNLIIISFGLTGIMTSYDMLRYVESSLNSEAGLGTASLASIYAMNIFCALFIPTYFIQRFGCKRTFLIAIIFAFIYYSSHFYPSYYTLLPGGLFMGFALGLSRTSANTLVTQLAIAYSKLTNQSTPDVINSFFGIFIFATFTARIWGNLTQSLILTQDDGIQAKTSNLQICGKNYCWQDLKTTNSSLNGTAIDLPIGNDNPNSPVSKQAYTLYAVTTVVGVLTLIIVGIFMDNRGDTTHEISDRKQILKQVVATFTLIKEPQMWLMIPITFSLGLIESYMSSDYTKAFVTCSLGIHHVGFVIICYGCTASLSSYFWGWLANKMNRPTVVIIGTIINMATIMIMLFWKPDSKTPVIFYVLSGAWGLADAVWRSQLYAMYGYVFYTQKEAGFANFEVWESIGLVIGYAYHDIICIPTKLYIIAGTLAIGVICYLVVELLSWRAKRKGSTLSTAFQP